VATYISYLERNLVLVGDFGDGRARLVAEGELRCKRAIRARANTAGEVAFEAG